MNSKVKFNLLYDSNSNLQKKIKIEQMRKKQDLNSKKFTRNVKNT